jgi:hypothetical protein
MVRRMERKKGRGGKVCEEKCEGGSLGESERLKDNDP